MPTRHALALSTVLLLAACALDEASDPEDIGFRPCSNCKWGPPLLNSHGVNGVPVSALDTAGNYHDGWRLGEVHIPGDLGVVNRRVHGVHADEGVLYGLDDWGAVVSGAQFVGSLWTIELEETGTKEQLRITHFHPDPDAARYTFIASASSIGVTDPKLYTCPMDDDTGDFAAVLFSDLDVDRSTGTHFERAETIYFACAAAAVGKAAVWGYSPWSTDATTHQVASRAVRADYCGNGQSYTEAGTALQLRDVFGINDFADPGQKNEAFWGERGALCVDIPRYVEPGQIDCNGEVPPPCKDSAFKDHPDAVLWSKVWF
jgi:hypothetical protein